MQFPRRISPIMGHKIAFVKSWHSIFTVGEGPYGDRFFKKRARLSAGPSFAQFKLILFPLQHPVYGGSRNTGKFFPYTFCYIKLFMLFVSFIAIIYNCIENNKEPIICSPESSMLALEIILEEKKCTTKRKNKINS